MCKFLCVEIHTILNIFIIGLQRFGQKDISDEDELIIKFFNLTHICYLDLPSHWLRDVCLLVVTETL